MFFVYCCLSYILHTCNLCKALQPGRTHFLTLVSAKDRKVQWTCITLWFLCNEVFTQFKVRICISVQFSTTLLSKVCFFKKILKITYVHIYVYPRFLLKQIFLNKISDFPRLCFKNRGFFLLNCGAQYVRNGFSLANLEEIFLEKSNLL